MSDWLIRQLPPNNVWTVWVPVSFAIACGIVWGPPGAIGIRRRVRLGSHHYPLSTVDHQPMKNVPRFEIRRDVVDVTRDGTMPPFERSSHREFAPGETHYFVDCIEVTEREYQEAWTQAQAMKP